MNLTDSQKESFARIIRTIVRNETGGAVLRR